MTIDREKLKALAKLATQGDWERDGYQVCPVADQNASLGSFGKSTDAAYVAALQPSVILALLAEIDDQALQARSAREVCLESQAAILSLISERDQLKAENEALRRDAENWKTVQRAMEQLKSDEQGAAIWSACSRILISLASDLNSARSVVTEEGVTKDGAEIGDWRVTVERLAMAKEATHG